MNCIPCVIRYSLTGALVIVLMSAITGLSSAEDLIRVSGYPVLTGSGCGRMLLDQQNEVQNCTSAQSTGQWSYTGTAVYEIDPVYSYSRVNYAMRNSKTEIYSGDDVVGVDFQFIGEFNFRIRTGADHSGRADAILHLGGEIVIQLNRWCQINATSTSGSGGSSNGLITDWTIESRLYGPVGASPLPPFRFDEPRYGNLMASGVYPPGEYRIQLDWDASAEMNDWQRPFGSLYSRDSLRWRQTLLEAVEVDPPPCGEGGPCPGLMDDNGDGLITVADVAAWYDHPFDVDGDGVADFYDLNLLAAEAGVSLVDCDENGYFDAVDIYWRPCWDQDLDGDIDACSDPEAPQDPYCSYPTNLNVNPAGSDDNAATASDPLGTLNFAVSKASFGDTITLQPGNYVESGIALPDGVLIRGEPAGGAKTVTSVIIDAEGGGSIFTGSSLPSGSMLEGLTLVRAGSPAVDVSGTHLTIRDCHFEDNTGGAINSVLGSLEIWDTEFRRNSRSTGAAVHSLGSGLSIYNSLLWDNRADNDGGAIYAVSPGVARIYNTVFRYNQTVSNGGAVYMVAYDGGSVELVGCDFIGNSSWGGAAVFMGSNVSSADPTYHTLIQDCLFAENSGYEIVATSPYSTTISRSTLSHSTSANVLNLASGSTGWVEVLWTLIADNDAQAIDGRIDTLHGCNIWLNSQGDFVGPLAGLEDGTTNFSADPVFCMPYDGIFMVEESSPCLVANSPLSSPADVGSEGQGCVSSVPHQEIPTGFRLLAAYPNPFNPQTTIAFELPEAVEVKLRIVDLSGRQVRELIAGRTYAPGHYEVIWNGRDRAGRQAASGTYFYSLQAGEFTETRRMTLVK